MNASSYSTREKVVRRSGGYLSIRDLRGAGRFKIYLILESIQYEDRFYVRCLLVWSDGRMTLNLALADGLDMKRC
jgi:hypothetical protein